MLYQLLFGMFDEGWLSNVLPQTTTKEATL
jgi:hypothetical protein